MKRDLEEKMETIRGMQQTQVLITMIKIHIEQQKQTKNLQPQTRYRGSPGWRLAGYPNFSLLGLT